MLMIEMQREKNKKEKERERERERERKGGHVMESKNLLRERIEVNTRHAPSVFSIFDLRSSM